MADHSFDALDNELAHAADGFARERSRDPLVHGCKVIKHLLAHPEWSQQSTEKQVTLLNQGAGFHLNLFKSDGDPKILREALVLLKVAVQLDDVPNKLRWSVLSNYGMALRNAAERFGETELLEEAIQSLEQALALAPEPAERARAQTNLAMAYYYKFAMMGEEDDLHHARSHLEIAFDGADNDTAKAVIASSRSIVEKESFNQTGKPKDLEAAIAYAEKAVRLTPANAGPLGARLNNLGIATASRYALTGNLADVTKAIHALEKAFTLVAPGHSEYPMRALNVALRHLELFQVTKDPGALDDALEKLSLADQHGDPNHNDFVFVQQAFAEVLSRKARLDGDEAISNQAVDKALGAITKSADKPERLRRALVTASTAYRFRSEITDSTQDHAAAKAAIIKAIDLSKSAPNELALAQFADLQIDISEYTKKDIPGDQPHQSETLRAKLRDLDDLSVRPGGARVIADQITYARSRLRAAALDKGDLALAIGLTEDARAISFRRDITLTDFEPRGLDEVGKAEFITWRNRLRAINAFLATPPTPNSTEQRAELAQEADILSQKFNLLLQKTDFAPPPDEDMHSVMALSHELGAIFVYVLLGFEDQPGHIIIFDDQAGHPVPELLNIEQLSETVIFDRLYAGLNLSGTEISKTLEQTESVSALGTGTLYQVAQSQHLSAKAQAVAKTLWRERLGSDLNWLNETIAEPLTKRLGSSQKAPIVLLPDARLNALPIHATDALRTFKTPSVSYVPSAGTLRALQNKPSASPTQSVHGVYDAASNLKFDAAEIHAVLEQFEKRGSHASLGGSSEWLRASIADADILCLSIHALFDPANPYASELIFGHSDRLSLASILAGTLRLKSGVTIIANACETGALDPRLAAEEHLGFPGALLASGAKFVTSSTWVVNDLAAAVFNLELSKRMTQNMPHAQCAWEAMKAISQMDKKTLSQHLRRLRQAAPNWRDKLKIQVECLLLSDKHVERIKRPENWACFTGNGALK